jgi:hypothetical protein
MLISSVQNTLLLIVCYAIDFKNRDDKSSLYKIVLLPLLDGIIQVNVQVNIRYISQCQNTFSENFQ